MFSKSFKLIFGVGAGIVATCALAAAAIGGFWLINFWVQNPSEKQARYIELSGRARDALCADLPEEWNKYVQFARKDPIAADMPGIKPGTVLTAQELEVAQRQAQANARNRIFVEKARDYCR